MLTSYNTSLEESAWKQHAARHREQVIAWTMPCRRRRASRKKHPVHDFLFTYYPFSLGKLEQWHPGFGVALEHQDDLPAAYRGKHYRSANRVVTLDAGTLADKQALRLKWIHNLLTLTQHRPAHFACFGMHEWAMVYQGGDIRHRESAPLRLTQRETDHIIETFPISCTHFDAFRFFPPTAQPLNRIQPTLDAREQNEQPGCLHSNMDLYKWASKSMPWISSDLLWQCFELALQARELDMRASPYDLTDYGYSPIKIETPGGRQQYEREQRRISESALPLRQQLIDLLACVLEATTHHRH